MRIPDSLLDEILGDVALYKIGTLASFAAADYLARCPARHIRRTVTAFVEQGHLQEGPLLTTGNTYCALSERSARRLKLPVTRSGLLSVDPLITAAAILQFCRLGRLDGPRRELLTRSQLERFFPQLMRPGLGGPFYLDDQTGRLARIRFDRARPRRWDRILQRCRRDLARLQRDPPWNKLLQAGRLQITVLTVLPQKVPRLEAELAQLARQSGLLFRVEALPGLWPLVRPQPIPNP